MPIGETFPSWFDRKTTEIWQYLEDQTSFITDQMKSQAPWEDDTGRARDSLKAKVDLDLQTGFARFTISLFYDNPEVTYSHELEFELEGKYAIVQPTAQIVRRIEPANIAARLGAG